MQYTSHQKPTTGKGSLALLQAVTVPVSMVWGEEDPWEKTEWGRELAKYHSVEEFVSLPPVGHCPQVSAWSPTRLWLQCVGADGGMFGRSLCPVGEGLPAAFAGQAHVHTQGCYC